MNGIKIEGLKEYQAKFKQVRAKAPQRIIEKTEEIGQDFKGRAIENSPEKSGQLKDSYVDRPVIRLGSGYSKTVYNKAPHFHLVEKGHRLVAGGKLGKDGREIGWVDGLFMFEDTVNQHDKTITPTLMVWLDELYEELE